MKDYVDMAAHLERHPQIRCVVNFVPVLLDQIEDYAQAVRQRAASAIPCCACWRHPTSAASAKPNGNCCWHLLPQQPHHHAGAVSPLQAPARPLPDAHGQEAKRLRYLSGAYFSDLVTWYHLAWTGETERRRNPLLAG
jgi:hypothetical protein